MKKSYIVLMIVSVLTTIAVSVGAFNSFQELINLLMNGRQLRTQRENLITLLSDLKDAETGQRGYIITGQESFLEPYYQALQIIERHTKEINKELSSSLKQIPLLENLNQLIEQKLSNLSRSINIRREEGFISGQKEVSSQEGKQIMDQIREVMKQLLANQNQEIEKNAQKVDVMMNKSFLLIFFGGLSSSLLICLLSFLFFRDSSELAKVKQQLRKTNDLYKAILDSAKQMIITTNTEGKVTSFNKAAEKILEYRAEEAMQARSILDFYEPKELQKKAEELSKKALYVQYRPFDTLVASSRFLLWVDSEWTMKKKNGQLFSSSQTITALRDEAGNVTGYLMIASDVSNAKRWDKELQEAELAIEKAQIAQERFLTSLNHEFKAPLHTIMNLVEVLINNKSGNLKESDLGYAIKIKHNCQVILTLIDQVIEVEKA